MNFYRSNTKKLPGTEYAEVYPAARAIYRRISANTKRRPYVRSKYFKNEKVFLDYFWEHLHQKNSKDRVRRLKLYDCALDLLKNSKVVPLTRNNPNKAAILLHKFTGQTPDGSIFIVQISEDRKSGKKAFLSVFPE